MFLTGRVTKRVIARVTRAVGNLSFDLGVHETVGGNTERYV